MHKQNQPYGCGVYAIANACNLPGFITPERLEASKQGNTTGQLSRWLQDDGNPYAIDALYYNHLGKKLPASALSYKPSGDDVALLPVLINVRLSSEGKNHLIGGKIDKQGKLYLYDSLKESMVETTLAKVNRMYHTVYGLFILVGIEKGEYVFI